MSINDIGKVGERMARAVLIHDFRVDDIFQPDWMIRIGSKYYVVEVKHKAMYEAPPFDGQGLDVRQVNARMRFWKDTGIRCIFLVIDMEGNIYVQWLDVLEKGEHFDTKNGIRVYNLNGFKSRGTYHEKINSRSTQTA